MSELEDALAARRRELPALARAEAALERLVAAIVAEQDAGGRPNIRAIAAQAGTTRQTLHRQIAAHRRGEPTTNREATRNA